MASKSLTFELFGKDKTASKALDGVSTHAEKMGNAFRNAGKIAAVGLAVAGAAAVAFGISSVKAFSEAQAQQERLNFAYKQFPALADATRESFDKLNSALQTKTGFDDDAIAASEGVLAQFGLTGTQVQKLTPLLLDYARANGKDLTSSAEDFGKALLGQGRALKTIGLDFDDAGSTAANFDQLVSGLTTNVGSYAEEFGTTAAGKFEILTVTWGDFQEKVGSALLPGLEKLMDFATSDVLPSLSSFAEWFGNEGVGYIKAFVDKIAELAEEGTLVPSVVAGLAAIAGGALALSLAMDANPVGLLILGLSVIAAEAALVIANWGTVTSAMSTGAGGAINAIMGIATGVAGAIEGVMNTVIGGINAVIGAINGVLSLLGVPTLSALAAVDFASSFANTAGRIAGANNALATGGLAGVADYGTNTNSGPSGSHGGGGMKLFADGGLVKGGRGGVIGKIGEKSYDELVVPLKPGMSFGGGGVTVVINGSVLSDERKIAAAVRNAVKNEGRRGFSTQGAFA